LLGELLLRFVLGGAIVCAFAALAEIFRPKTFAGLFGSAPSVALATLALAFHRHGPSYAAAEARSMLIGSVGLLAYSIGCVAVAKRARVPVWLGAGAAWALWLAVAFGLFALAGMSGAR